MSKKNSRVFKKLLGLIPFLSTLSAVLILKSQVALDWAASKPPT